MLPSPEVQTSCNLNATPSVCFWIRVSLIKLSLRPHFLPASTLFWRFLRPWPEINYWAQIRTIGKVRPLYRLTTCWKHCNFHTFFCDRKWQKECHLLWYVWSTENAVVSNFHARPLVGHTFWKYFPVTYKHQTRCRWNHDFWMQFVSRQTTAGVLKLLSCLLPAHMISGQCLEKSHLVDIRAWLRLKANLQPTVFLVTVKLVLLLLIACF